MTPVFSGVQHFYILNMLTNQNISIKQKPNRNIHLHRAVRIKFRDLLQLNTLVDLKQPLTDKQTK